MSSRTARRCRHKRLARIAAQRPDKRARDAARTLVQWQVEARRRARSLGAPGVWDLARAPQIREVAHGLDPTGELQSDLDRVCAEEVAAVAGRHLVGASRPLADRRRHERAG